MTYTGIPVVNGIAHSLAYVIKPSETIIIRGEGCDPAAEKLRFHEARRQSLEDVEQLRRHTLATLGEEEAKIFEAHQSLLEDMELIGSVEHVLSTEECSAEWAVSKIGTQFIEIFKAMENEYMQERAADIKDITDRILSHLQGLDDSMQVREEAIVVAHELTPSMTAAFDRNLVKGIVTEVGGKTSHSAIIANLLEIPYVVIPNIIKSLEQGDRVLIDGESGILVKDPDQETIKAFMEKANLIRLEKEAYESLKGQEALTEDGIRYDLMANIGGLDDLPFVLEKEVANVGLFRTEFLFMHGSQLPTEEEQYQVYKKVAQSMPGAITIRTLDIGGDKGSDHFNIPKEDNPFLGYRGIRLCLGEPEIFKIQLRAILRASAFGNLKIMFPMISAMHELVEAKSLLALAKEELKQEGHHYDEAIRVGMMMETPSAVLMADAFAKEVDFFSVGTNDLVQYTMAVDRLNGRIEKLYSAYDPAILRSMKLIASAANEADIPVSICGEAAADTKLLPVWLGLGIRHLSMSASSVPKVKWHLSKLNAGACEALVSTLLTKSAKSDIVKLLG